jgi:hypothetical protein
VGELRKANLGSAANIAKSDLQTITAIFTDEKVAKQIFSAAKRVTNPKKRAASSDGGASTVSKLRKGLDGSAQPALDLPCSDLGGDDLGKTIVQTNRAPLVLAFAVTLLKYTRPEQPMSSRLSLAQAVVSANSQSKAKSIGITNENTAEEEGWGKGQPKIKVMGREIAVMRRAPTEGAVTSGSDQTGFKVEQVDHETFWGLDLDALRKSNGPLIAGKNSGSVSGLPIYSPESARNYLLRSMAISENIPNSEVSSKPESGKEREASPKKKQSAKEAASKEEAAARLLKALELLFSSWSHLSKDELDRRAWSWYLHVRPDIAQGQAGWGQKGQVKLADILKLRKDPEIDRIIVAPYR